ncbi:MAG: hypothetical protein ABI472_04395 [Ginsengibacter sp.]
MGNCISIIKRRMVASHLAMESAHVVANNQSTGSAGDKLENGCAMITLSKIRMQNNGYLIEENYKFYSLMKFLAFAVSWLV